MFDGSLESQSGAINFGAKIGTKPSSQPPKTKPLTESSDSLTPKGVVDNFINEAGNRPYVSGIPPRWMYKKNGVPTDVPQEVANLLDKTNFKTIQPTKVTKTSNNLYHTTPIENLESIKQNGLTTGNKPRFEGVSGGNNISFSANEAGAKYYSGNNDVMIRTKTSYKPTDLETDLLAGGEGTYITHKNIPPEMLEVKINGKWQPLSSPPTPKGVIPEGNLLEEAKKYKSAEEFIKAQGEPLYHGSPTDRLNTGVRGGYSTPNDAGKGIYFTDDLQRAKEYSQVGGLKTATVTEARLNMKNPIEVTGKFIDKKLVAEAKAKGFDGIINKNVEGIQGYNEYLVFDKSQVKTKQQLTDIYNQSKGVETKVTMNEFENALFGGKFSPKEMRSMGLEVQAGSRLMPGAFQLPEGKTLTDIYNQANLPQTKGIKISASPKSPPLKLRSPSKPSSPNISSGNPLIDAITGTKERKFVTTVKDSVKTAPEVKNMVQGQYIPDTNDALSRSARRQIKTDIDAAREKALTGLDDESIAIASELIQHYSNLKDFDTATYIANTTAENLTAHGKAVQAASLYDKLSPEGIQRYAATQLKKVKQELKPEDAKRLYNMAKKVQAMPPGEGKAMAQQKLMSEIQDLIPTPLIEKLITVWKAGLLTGLKTTGRNIAGNTINLVAETVKDVPATLTDMVASLFTGERTKVFTIKGIGQGVKEGGQKGIKLLKT